MNQNFGQVIRQARKDKGFSQRELAKRIGLDFTYLSKLENSRADYPPKEDVIRSLARNLDLDEEELVFLAGRIPRKEEDLLKLNYKAMPRLFRKIRENPEYARQLLENELGDEDRDKE